MTVGKLSGLTNPMSAVGDIIIGGASGTPARLALGATRQTPISNGATIVADYPVSGRKRVVYPEGFNPQVNITTSAGLGASGGSNAVEVFIGAPMYLDKLFFRNNDASGTRSAEFVLLRDDGAAAAVCVAAGSTSFTGAGSANKAVAFTSAPVTVPPGNYWFVIRNTGGASDFTVFYSLAGATTLGVIGLQNQVLGSALPAVGATLDMTTGWTRTSVNTLAIALVGRVFGEGSSF